MKTTTRVAAAALDQQDVLASLRERYDLHPDVIRLDGNSVGPLSRVAPARPPTSAEHPRFAPPGPARPDHDRYLEMQQATERLAPLVGADPAEIGLTDSTSMSLFRALLTAADLRSDRPVLLLGQDCFSTDRYLARSVADFTGRDLVLLERLRDLPDKLDARVAVVALSHTDTVSGTVRDSAAITAEIHRAGALALWELSHSAGALHVDLHAWEADFAIGCGDKYLGGGHTAPAYSFVARRHHADVHRALPNRDGSGGADVLDPPAMDVAASPMQSISGFHEGLAALEGVSTSTLEAKTSGLITLFLARVNRSPDTGVDVLGPSRGSRRGTQLSLRHRHARYLAQSMFARGVLLDFLEPDILRLGFAPSWLRYVDVWEAAEALNEALDEVTRYA
ncbi:kynureninase [Halopolyspora algeriensis]|uniref:Kynureninase n=1 Tax=Halopolyspora algeriensis TaxID=1500506 RepID=A0A368VJ90_9ACTN|nr:aminotransferase class V-fold PLP-dependent enzyme [Halopolyspora algeriensis]RCW40274.1 kynureninase [Halopolyspora algeriensis]TQM46245.1 kynureninase [Halopolyspora algeriensis]